MNKKLENRKLIIGIIIIGAFISSLNQTVMTASLPRIMTDFGISAGIGQWLTTGYLLFMGVMIPCTGYLMEHFSSKKLYLVSVSLFFTGCAVAAFSSNVSMLLLARIIQALGAGILLPLPQVVAFRLYAPEERGTIMGIVGLTTGFAPAFGPTFAGWIADFFGWRTIFYIMCVLAALGIILAIIKLPDEKMHSDGKLDILSVILSTIGFCCLLTGVSNQGNYGFLSTVTIVPLLTGILCVTLFAIRQLKISSPLLELRIFRNRNFAFGTILLIFAYGSMLSVSTLLPIYIQNLRGYSATVSGLVMLPGALFLAFLNPLCGRILDKRGPYLLSLAGLALLGSATFGLHRGRNTAFLYYYDIWSSYAWNRCPSSAIADLVREFCRIKVRCTWNRTDEYAAAGWRLDYQCAPCNSHVIDCKRQWRHEGHSSLFLGHFYHRINRPDRFCYLYES